MARRVLLAVLTSLILSAAGVGCASHLPLPFVPDPPVTVLESPLPDSAAFHQPTYRDDPVEQVAVSGRPQLIVFYTVTSDISSCPGCDQIRPLLQDLETEYVHRVDFVYLDYGREEVQPLLKEYEITAFGKPHLLFIAPDGSVVRRFHTGWQQGELPDARDFRFTFDRYLESLMIS